MARKAHNAFVTVVTNDYEGTTAELGVTNGSERISIWMRDRAEHKGPVGGMEPAGALELATDLTERAYELLGIDYQAIAERARTALATWDTHGDIVGADGFELSGSVERAEWLIAALRPIITVPSAALDTQEIPNG